MPQSDPVHT